MDVIAVAVGVVEEEHDAVAIMFGRVDVFETFRRHPLEDMAGGSRFAWPVDHRGGQYVQHFGDEGGRQRENRSRLCATETQLVRGALILIDLLTNSRSEEGPEEGPVARFRSRRQNSSRRSDGPTP